MGSFLEAVLGAHRAITVPEMAVRAVIIYVAGLVIVRFAKNRLLGRSTAFDIILGFILGSLFSRAINGGAPLIASVVAGAVLAIAHWVLALLTRHSESMDATFKGRARKLVEDGEVRRLDLRRAEMSERDLLEAVHLRGLASVDEAEAAWMEPNGQIAVVPRRREARILEVRVADGVQVVRIEMV